MNLILFEAGELEGDRLELTDRRAEHVAAVIRPEAGARLRIGQVRGPRGWARVVASEPGRLILALEPLGPAAAPPPTSLILALPRPKVLARVLAAAASLGVRRIELTNAWRVEKSYFASPALAPAALEAALRGGCEQGGLTWVPEIAVHRRLMPLLDGLGDDPALRLIAHPGAPSPIEGAAAGLGSRPLLLAIGPEGGWIARELASFAERGFTPISAGEAIMRVEVAVSALLAQLALLRRTSA